MKIALLAVMLAVAGLSSCTSEFGESSASRGLLAGVGQIKTSEAALISAFQEEDRKLRYLSAGTYSCGDPRSENVRLLTSIGDPNSYIEDRLRRDSAWTASIATIENYQRFLKEIAEANKASQETINQLKDAASKAASTIPSLSPLSAFVIPVGDLMRQATNAASWRDVRLVAHSMHVPLTKAAEYIEKSLPDLSSNEKLAYNLWDACAREKLLFIRDAPLARIRDYNHPVLFAQSSGIELESAYQDYLNRRTQLRQTRDITKLADQLIEENKKLMATSNRAYVMSLLDTLNATRDLIKVTASN